jgi:hypothetical protein
LPKRTETEYIVHDWTLAGWDSCVSGEVDAIVEVGGVLVVVELPEPVEPADDALEVEEPVLAGEGDTIEAGAVELDDDGVADAVALVEDDDPLGGVADAGLGLSFDTPLANGLRAMRASTTFTGSADGVVAPVVVCAVVAVAAGGAATVGVVLAEAPWSRNTGAPTRATTRIATTIHSLRSTRSRRSELILVLRSSRRPCRPTGRWWR